MGKLLPLILALLGLGAGVGAGVLLRPDPEEVHLDNPCGEVTPAGGEHDAPVEDEEAEDASLDYVKLNNQFVVPVVDSGRVASLVVMSLSLEVPAGQTEEIYRREPKLRDAFLQVMFDHANSGGFEGNFTSGGQMNVLRGALREMAQSVLGPTITDVLITDIVRQDA